MTKFLESLSLYGELEQIKLASSRSSDQTQRARDNFELNGKKQIVSLKAGKFDKSSWVQKRDDKYVVTLRNGELAPQN